MWPWVGAALIGLVLSGGWVDVKRPRKPEAAEDSVWGVGKPVAIAVQSGRAIFRAPANRPGSEILVVVSALSRSRGPYTVGLSARPATKASKPLLADDGPVGTAESHAEVPPPSPVPEHAHRVPAKDRVFHMLVRDGDVYSPSNYVAIPAALRGVGRRIQVYVASEDLDSVGAELVGDIISTFDGRIFPVASSRFGPAPDVDGDGRFTVLLSSWLDHLGGGRYAVDGFVRVADLDRAFRPPLGNQCDMMYLSTTLKSGPYLRTVMAHEYMHAVLLGQKGRNDKKAGAASQEEEGWLDEAIAHLAEDYYGFSTSNIDYRVSAFLASPERYQLVVDDYYAADLFRSHGNRGSTYLFLKWCADRYGPGLLPALVHSRLRGVANLEGGTGTAFAALYRGWSLDLVEKWLESGSESRGVGVDRVRSEKRRSQPAEWELAGPRVTHVAVSGSLDRWTAPGTSSHFAIVDGSTSGAVEIEVSGPPEAELQVTAVPMGDDLARLELSAVKIRGASGDVFLRAHVKERHGVPVRLSLISWEPATPGPNPRAGAAFRGRLGQNELEKAFGAVAVPPAGELTSQPIRLSGGSGASGPLIVKVVGVDARGRRVSTWADLDLDPPER